MVRGFYYQKKGRLNTALPYLEKTKPLFEELGYLFYKSVLFGHMGGIFESKGELDKAQEFFKMQDTCKVLQDPVQCDLI